MPRKCMFEAGNDEVVPNRPGNDPTSWQHGVRRNLSENYAPPSETWHLPVDLKVL